VAVIVGSLAYALLGLACLTAGVKTRRGIGTYRVSRQVRVSYEELPLRERVRTGNALFAFGAALLLCAAFSLVPDPVTAALFLTALLLFVVYVVVQRGLRRAAQEIARTRAN
jgi:membrane protein YqaA with SNARE-associated domain